MCLSSLLLWYLFWSLSLWFLLFHQTSFLGWSIVLPFVKVVLVGALFPVILLRYRLNYPQIYLELWVPLWFCLDGLNSFQQPHFRSLGNTLLFAQSRACLALPLFHFPARYIKMLETVSYLRISGPLLWALSPPAAGVVSQIKFVIHERA